MNMTIAAAWFRKVNNCEELWFVSDSRLCGGHRWDECPKIFPLQRSDCAISFAGDTGYAYPMMMQTYLALGELSRIKTRAMDIVDLNGYVLKHINHLASTVYDKADDQALKDNQFLFGGYSWVEKRFKLWRYYYHKTDKCFKKDGQIHNFERHFGNIKVIGDQDELLKSELRRLLHEKYGETYERYNGEEFDLEPFEALCNVLKKVSSGDTIGGAPQVIKVYQHMNAIPIGVYWPQKEEDPFKNRTIMGRKMFEFEDTDHWFLDPLTLRTSRCIKTAKDDE